MGEEQQMIIDINKDRIEKEYYINRSGKIIKYAGVMDQEIISFHYQIASQLYPDARDPEKILMSLGYVLVGSTHYHHPIIHTAPSQSQVNKLFDLGLFDHLRILQDGFYHKLT